MLETLTRIETLQKRAARWAPEAVGQDHRPTWDRIRSVRDAISVLSKDLQVPEHLAPYLDFLDTAVGQGRRFVFHAPPQHAKTESLAHAFIAWAILHPGKRHAFATYNDDRTLEVLARVRWLASEAGLEPATRKGLMKLRGGTEIKFTSITGSLTGRPIDGVMAIDDPIKSAEDARSKRHRDMCWRFLSQTAETRMHPGASCFVMMTRWHPDDLAGRCINEGYESIRLPAIAEADDPLGRKPGEALWPDKRPIEFLEKLKRSLGPTAWAAMGQGRPQAEGAEAFGPPSFYDEIPKGRSQIAYGIDCAYTAKTTADYSVIVRMLKAGDTYYVTRVWRLQCDAPRFSGLLKQVVSERPGGIRWYVAGAEKGVADMLRRSVPTLKAPAATADKFVRSAPLRAAWDDGRVLLKEGAPWVREVVDETEVFTGNNDAHDDIIDAMAAAFDELDRRSTGMTSDMNLHIAPRM